MKTISFDETKYQLVSRNELMEYLEYSLADTEVDERSKELKAMLASAPQPQSQSPEGGEPVASVFLRNIHYFYAQTDGSYAWPKGAVGDLLKQAKREIEAAATPPAAVEQSAGLNAKVQFLIDMWPTRLEDGGFTFPDGEFWPASATRKEPTVPARNKVGSSAVEQIAEADREAFVTWARAKDVKWPWSELLWAACQFGISHARKGKGKQG